VECLCTQWLTGTACSYLRVLKQLARTDVLLLDDWVLHGISRAQQRDLMELVEDPYTLRSTIVTVSTP